jgi:Leucine-rich repeat (LRR) protein
VPRQLSSLSQLTFLDLGDNDGMASGYEHLGQLVKLEDLDLCACARAPEQVPASLANLTAPTCLDLNNPTSGVTEGGWEHLQPLGLRLRELNLGASLTEIPACLSHLTAVTWLGLSWHTLLHGDAWQHLSLLRQLRFLDAHSCELEEVPAELSSLTQLTELILEDSEMLEAGWEHLAPLRRCQSLDLRNCGLDEVPASLSHQTALTMLALDLNAPRRGWQHLRPLQQLRALHMRDCGLTKLPTALSAFTLLTALDCSANAKLASGWKHLKPLRHSLLEAHFSSCGLLEVPAVLSALTNLTHLSLAGHRTLWCGWEHLDPLRRLVLLDLSSCSLERLPEELIDLLHSSPLLKIDIA